MTELQLPWAFAFDVYLRGGLEAEGDYEWGDFAGAAEACVAAIRKVAADNPDVENDPYGMVTSSINFRGDNAINEMVYDEVGYSGGTLSDEMLADLEADYRRGLITDAGGEVIQEEVGDDFLDVAYCTTCERPEGEHWLIMDENLEAALLCGDWEAFGEWERRSWFQRGVRDAEVVEHLYTIGASFSRHELAPLAERGWAKSLQSIMQGDLLEMKDRLT